MSLTSQKRDIHDPNVINDFARQMGDQMHLDYLYLLTVADIRATNPKLWNSWREALLRELYDATRRALRRGLGNPIDKEERIRETQGQARNRLTTNGIDNRRINAVWDGFGDDYFLRHSADEIVWHTRAILKKADDGRPLVLARQDRGRGGTQIFVYTRDQDQIFAVTTSTLDRLGLTVLDARIITSRSGYTLDSYTVVEDSGKPIEERHRIKEIIVRLRQHLSHPDARPRLPTRRVPRVMALFQTPTQVNFISDESNDRTVVELVTTDHPGLLGKIGQAFTDCGVRLQNAKIATIGARAEDVFFITDQQNRPIREAHQYIALRESLLQHLQQQGQDSAQTPLPAPSPQH
jgi:[protein-PII] uridylyltransferase